MEMMYSRYTKELRNTSCQNNRMILFNSAASENMSLRSVPIIVLMTSDLVVQKQVILF